MKTAILATLALPLSGCMTIQAIAQRAAFPGAVGAETRVGANCIRATEAGLVSSRVPVLVTENARDAFDVILGVRLTEAERIALARVRTRVSAQCPQLPLPPVEPPVEPPALPE